MPRRPIGLNFKERASWARFQKKLAASTKRRAKDAAPKPLTRKQRLAEKLTGELEVATKAPPPRVRKKKATNRKDSKLAPIRIYSSGFETNRRRH
jgi:hypothetical protein